MPAACQSSLLHPSTFAFRGFEGAKRQRLCQPSGNPLGPNLAGVFPVSDACSPVTLGLWRAFGMADAARFCSGPLRPPNQCLPLDKASCFNRPPLLLVGAKVPNSSGSADLVVEWLMPHGAAQGRYVRPTNACCLPKLPALTRPPLLLGGSKVPNGSGSADQVATRWAWILLGFPCFGCVLTGDAGGCDVPLEWLMPHGFARGPLRPPNQCLPLAKASCFNRPPWLLVGVEGAKRQRLCRPSGNPVGVNLAGVSLFRMRAHGCTVGCDVPLERLMPHGAAQGRYVRPTNACCLPKLPASPVHLCF